MSTGAGRTRYGLFVDGEEREANDGRTFLVQNPASGEALLEVADAGGVADAIASAWTTDVARAQASGTGRENGIGAYRSYTQTKSVIVNTSAETFDWYATDEELRYS